MGSVGTKLGLISLIDRAVGDGIRGYEAVTCFID